MYTSLWSPEYNLGYFSLGNVLFVFCCLVLLGFVLFCFVFPRQGLLD